MKQYFLFICSLLVANMLYAQQRLTGRVSDTEGNPLAGASVRYISTGHVIVTNSDGAFSLPQPFHADTILVSYIGYVKRRLPVATGEYGPLRIELTPDPNTLEEVMVNTGYYRIPKERATGSFEYVDITLINRSVSGNILQRLEGVVSGVQFVEPQSGEASGIRIRGLSTIEADTRPLIVLDNFPYEGDINTINPNDVENITVLKDAAAASIWGARAGNGVIVINTKQGTYRQPTKVTVNANVTVGEKPNLFYSHNYLPAPTVMEIQKELFERGAYSERDQTYIPSYVELLIKQRDGLISEAAFEQQESFMQHTDLRRDAMKYLYQPSINQQYGFSAQGGGSNYRYALSTGYDQNQSHVIGNNNERLNLSLQNTFLVRSDVEISGSIWYTRQRAVNNGITHTQIGLFNSTLTSANIYDALLDANGDPAFTASAYRQAYRQQAEESDLQDWMYRPLEERRLSDQSEGSDEMRINGGVKYQFLPYADFNVTYQYTQSTSKSRSYFNPQTYYVRNLVNRFTQTDGTQLIPNGGILELGHGPFAKSHSGRAQLNINRRFKEIHELVALIGGEARQRLLETVTGAIVYDFDPDTWLGDINRYVDRSISFPTRPIGSARLPNTTSGSLNRIVTRDLSYFGNASYRYASRYGLSGSLRWDGSNLLGVKANQRGTSLWSLGGTWEISEERFYKSHKLPYLRLRLTYGSAGNIDKTQSHYPTIALGNNGITGLLEANLRHAGNPSLRWEQVNTLNAGLDWELFDGRASGSLAYYDRHAKHLLSSNLMDPTLGVGENYKTNYASLRTGGWDIQLNTRNLIGELKWNTTLLVNYTANSVTRYNGPEPGNITSVLDNSTIRKGSSVDLLYALPWYGLNSQTGYPIVYLDGQISDDYASYYNNFSHGDLIVVGLRVPPYFGSMRNTFRWRELEVGALIAFDFGSVFRRGSIGPGQEYLTLGPVYHQDYFKRWQKPGDERLTDVPAWAETTAPNQRFAVYQYSEALVTRGDQIRLQDVNASYLLPSSLLGNSALKSIYVYGYARNLGVIWRSNEYGIDPDYPSADYVAPRTFALGLRIEF